MVTMQDLVTLNFPLLPGERYFWHRMRKFSSVICPIYGSLSDLCYSFIHLAWMLAFILVVSSSFVCEDPAFTQQTHKNIALATFLVSLWCGSVSFSLGQLSVFLTSSNPLRKNIWIESTQNEIARTRNLDDVWHLHQNFECDQCHKKILSTKQFQTVARILHHLNTECRIRCYRCQKSLPRHELQKHFFSCGRVLVCCEYFEAGCTEIVERKDLPFHRTKCAHLGYDKLYKSLKLQPGKKSFFY